MTKIHRKKAKKKAKKRDTVNRISLHRFDALASYARESRAAFFGDELAWYEYANERVLGAVIRDRADGDYGGLVFGRDRLLRYRWVNGTKLFPTVAAATAALRRNMKKTAAEPDEEYHQGDEKGAPVDFFGKIPSKKALNPNFVHLRDLEVYSAARGIIEPMMRWYQDVDGNFIEQFQTTGFDARIWELYLFAAFREMNFDIDRKHPVPDFRCTMPMAGLEIFVEATTVNPTQDSSGKPIPPPKLKTPADVDAYLANYMPIKFGGALFSKMKKKDWEKPYVNDHPFVLAIQDFSSPQSMTYTRSAFENYITGYVHKPKVDASGDLTIVPVKIGTHTWKSKTINSGFFDQPDTENVSAVIFSNSGTISKFSRMGMLAGFGSPKLRLIRVGTAFNRDPNATSPLPFKYLVNDPRYDENWSEGLDVWHNPKAKVPLIPQALPFAAHHKILPNGQVVSTVPPWQPLGSFTHHDLKADVPKKKKKK